MNGKLFVSLAAVLIALPFSSSAAEGWKIDRNLKFHLVYLPSSESGVSAARLTPALLNIPAYEPDITNIGYKNILQLGFPLPTRTEPEKLKLYLKLYKWPKSLDPTISSGRVLDTFLLKGIPGGKNLYFYSQDRDHLLIKYATIDAGDKVFTQTQPTRSSEPQGQAEFDSSLPFSSIYVLPEKAANGSTEAEKAAASAGGVLAVHRAMIDLYSKALVPLKSAAESDKLYFAEQRMCSDRREDLCGLKIIEIQKKPFIFANYKDLPMPLNPKQVFLSGLLLAKVTDYAAIKPISGKLIGALVPGTSEFNNTFSAVWSHLLEVGSVFDRGSSKESTQKEMR